MARATPAWEQSGFSVAVAEALQALDVARLVLAIHDASFPAGAGDIGRGTPYSEAGRALFEFVRRLGFTGVQLGPQGLTTRDNPSPYDAMLFSRDPLAIAADALLPAARVAELAGDVPPESARHADHAGAFDRQARLLDAVFQADRRRTRGDVEAFARANASWLARDARMDPMPPEQYGFVQWLAALQHASLRRLLAQLGLRLYGDLQIGVSWRDRQTLAPLFLDGYRLGAPPSRTNPAGQPWNYPVLDPAQHDGPAGALVAARADKLLANYDGLRIDHPHGLVDPWVYAADAPDPLAAVRAGARLFSSPDLPDHPRLARFAVARPDQLDRAQVRWADGWVRALDEPQVDRYATLFSRIVERVRAHGRRTDDLLCEVLSTWPHPLRRVMEREGLGRLCVTQKANLDDPGDVYRSENARPCDWIMVGNHDTPPLWALVARWHGTDAAARRAAYLAERLEPDPSARPAFAARLAASPGQLATAMFAELFASPARSVSIFFADLFGYEEVYNRPGVVDLENWRLRVAPDYAAQYARAVAGEAPRALDLPRALAMALRAHPQRRAVHAELIARLEAFAVPTDR
jgi:4-alpha-glucanotransferase